jgi:hypothetical protein
MMIIKTVCRRVDYYSFYLCCEYVDFSFTSLRPNNGISNSSATLPGVQKKARRGSIVPVVGNYSSANVTNNNSNITSVSSNPTFPSNQPIPAGFTNAGTPYFTPPVNLPPEPTGYTSDITPYFGKTSQIKPQPYGMTTDGVRYYSPDNKLGEGIRNQIAGFDNNGQPFFIPKGCSLPTPIGFTPDGIAYYDVPSLMHHRGIMMLPTTKQDRLNWPLFDDSGEELELFEPTKENPLPKSKFEQLSLTNQLLETLKETQTDIRKSVVNRRFNKTIGTVRRIKDFDKSDLTFDFVEEIDSDSFDDPEDIISYLKTGDDFSYLKPASLRVTLEPQTLQFQSVERPISKSILLKYRAFRGDREEKDFYISVEPSDIFSVSSFLIKIQGEGVTQITITFNPKAMDTIFAEGSISLIDSNGKKVVTSTLLAIKKTFIQVFPSSIDCGWILPEKRKEVSIRVENTSSIMIDLNIYLASKIQAQEATEIANAVLDDEGQQLKIQSYEVDAIKPSTFSLQTSELRLQPGESKSIMVYFEPYNLGKFTDVLIFCGPGGDLIQANMEGYAGIPIAVIPESIENSLIGSENLTFQRTEFLKKFSSKDSDKIRTKEAQSGLNEKDIQIIHNMISANSDSESRKQVHTLDFGICQLKEASISRCVTLLNLSDSLMVLGLYSHNSNLKTKYLIQVPGRSAYTVDITLDVNEETKGNFKTVIEIICPDFQNIPLYVMAYIGQPLFFSSWDYAFFRPCPIGKTEYLTVNLVNDSHYDIDFCLDGLGNTFSEEKESYITSSISHDSSTRLKSFSLIPVQFSFIARQRGPLMQTVWIQITSPTHMIISSGSSKNSFSLIGICIEPWLHRPGEMPDKNGLEFLRMWMCK